jgi:hypothetical protein
VGAAQVGVGNVDNGGAHPSSLRAGPGHLEQPVRLKDPKGR